MSQQRARASVRLIGAAIAILAAPPGAANEVQIVDAKLVASGSGSYTASVTLRHADAGWDHYADAWRLVLEDGTALGTRTLLHPHDNEQPFTRSLSGVQIPAGVDEVLVEAHDKVHGWSSQQLRVAVPR